MQVFLLFCTKSDSVQGKGQTEITNSQLSMQKSADKILPPTFGLALFIRAGYLSVAAARAKAPRLRSVTIR